MPTAFPQPAALDDSALTDEGRDRLFEQIAEHVARRGLATPAIFFLEMNRPLTFLAGQATHLLAPFLAALIGIDAVRRVARLLEEPDNVDRLLDRLQTAEATRRSEKKP